MGNSTLQEELIRSENEAKIVGHIKTDVGKNAWMYIVVMHVDKQWNIFFTNSLN
jgi:hypothetical protein